MTRKSMCLSIPHKIIKLNKTKATVQCGKKSHTLDVRLVPDVKIGDYVLNENEFAIYKVPKKEAIETLKLFINA
jgi:hydrogenase expression/formation protein HypC